MELLFKIAVHLVEIGTLLSMQVYFTTMIYL